MGGIRQLLAARGSGGASDRESVFIDAHGPEVGADWGSLKSPETFVGHYKAEKFASPGGAAVDTRHVYAVPPRLRLNQWALSGEWTIADRQFEIDFLDSGVEAFAFTFG